MVLEGIKKALEELQVGLSVLEIGNNLVNALLVFLIIFLFGVVFDFGVVYALIISVACFVILMIKSFFDNRYLAVEEKVPELNEKLRTVADNVDKTNPIVDSLKDDVFKSMSKIKLGEFIDYNKVSIKILVIALFSIAIVILSFLNVSFDLSLGELAKDLGVREAGQDIGERNLTYLEGNLSEILGNKSIARLGTKELKLTINPLESDIDLSNIKKASSEEFNPPMFPKEIYTSYDLAYKETINAGNQKVIKNYFEQIVG